MNDGMKDKGGMVKGGGQSAVGGGQSAVGSGQSAEEARETVASLVRLLAAAREDLDALRRRADRRAYREAEEWVEARKERAGGAPEGGGAPRLTASQICAGLGAVDAPADGRAAALEVRWLARAAADRHGLGSVPLEVQVSFQTTLYRMEPGWRARRLASSRWAEDGTLDGCMRKLAEESGSEFMRREARRHRERADKWDRRADEEDARARGAKGEGNEG